MKTLLPFYLAAAMLLAPCLRAQSNLTSVLADDPGARIAAWQKKLEGFPSGKERDAEFKRLTKEEGAKAKSLQQHQRDQDDLKAAYQSMSQQSQPPKFAWVQLRRTSEGDGFKKSALFSYTRTDGKDVYLAKAAVIIGPGEFRTTDSTVDYWLGNDLDLSSDTAKNPGKIANHLVFWLHPTLDAAALSDADGWKGMDYFVDFAHEANRHFKTKALVAQVLAQPTLKAGDFALNWQHNLGTLGRYELSPLLGVEVGSTVDATKGASPEDGGFTRGIMKWHFSFVPAFAEGKLTLYADDTVRFLSDDHYHSYNLFSAGLEYEISDNVSLSIAQEIGRDSPTFEMSAEFSVGLGLKF